MSLLARKPVLHDIHRQTGRVVAVRVQKTLLPRHAKNDPLMRTLNINNQDSANNSLMNYAYDYDKVGNIKSKTTEHGHYGYGYDARYRLTSVDNPVVASVSSLVDEAYSYDDAGNRITDSSTTGAWVYNDTNQLESNSELINEYDFNGSTVKKTKAGVITTFDYNTENRLTTVKNNTGATVASYYYDPFGRRLYKDVAGSRTYFMYAQEGLIAELDSTGTVTQSYGYTPQSMYGTSPLYTKTSTGYAYYQLDHLGTPQQLVNKTGLVVWKAKSKSFGDTTVEVNTVTNNLRFPGQYFDAETGTHYNYFRDYEPGTGRYVQSDPIGLGGGLNAYGYVGGNPVYWSDPYGLKGRGPLIITIPSNNPNNRPPNFNPINPDAGPPDTTPQNFPCTNALCRDRYTRVCTLYECTDGDTGSSCENDYKKYTSRRKGSGSCRCISYRWKR